jgi:hypothetical protein
MNSKQFKEYLQTHVPSEFVLRKEKKNSSDTVYIDLEFTVTVTESGDYKVHITEDKTHKYIMTRKERRLTKRTYRRRKHVKVGDVFKEYNFNDITLDALITLMGEDTYYYNKSWVDYFHRMYTTYISKDEFEFNAFLKHVLMWLPTVFIGAVPVLLDKLIYTPIKSFVNMFPYVKIPVKFIMDEPPEIDLNKIEKDVENWMDRIRQTEKKNQLEQFRSTLVNDVLIYDNKITTACRWAGICTYEEKQIVQLITSFIRTYIGTHYAGDIHSITKDIDSYFKPQISRMCKWLKQCDPKDTLVTRVIEIMKDEISRSEINQRRVNERADVRKHPLLIYDIVYAPVSSVASILGVTKETALPLVFGPYNAEGWYRPLQSLRKHIQNHNYDHDKQIDDPPPQGQGNQQLIVHSLFWLVHAAYMEQHPALLRDFTVAFDRVSWDTLPISWLYSFIYLEEREHNNSFVGRATKYTIEMFTNISKYREFFEWFGTGYRASIVTLPMVHSCMSSYISGRRPMLDILNEEMAAVQRRNDARRRNYVSGGDYVPDMQVENEEGRSD